MAYSKPDESGKFVPGSDASGDEIFKFPFTIDDETIEFIKEHGHMMFIVRGLPGTGKSTLSDMLGERYPGGVLCCADHFFTNSFTSKERTREKLKESHDYCHRQVKKACQDGKHPIIVQNTHVTKREFQEYIDYAAEYDYTIIMAITLRKFTFNAAILEKSNKKGLTRSYFQNRIRQWKEIHPFYTGWFLCPDDVTYLHHLTQSMFEALLGDGKFCRVNDLYDIDDLLKHYQPKRKPFLVAAAASGPHFDRKMYGYYLSKKVQDVYGKQYPLTIMGYIVTKSTVVAVVHTTSDMEVVMMDMRSESGNVEEEDELSLRFESFSLGGFSCNKAFHDKVISYQKDYEGSPKTIDFINWKKKEESINVNECSFILLAHDENINVKLNSINGMYRLLLSPNCDEAGNIDATNILELKDGHRALHLTKNAWFVQAPKKISLKSIFTGLYV